MDGSNVKFFNSKTIDWDTGNLRMKSILNNYSLSVDDRQGLYRTVRTQTLQENYFLYQLIHLITGPPTGVNKKASRQQKERNANQRHSQIKRSGAMNDDGIPLVDLASDPLTPVQLVDNFGASATEARLQRLVQEAEMNESGLEVSAMYHFDPHFAAGMISTTSFMQSLLCQTFFRPYILDVVKCLIESISHLPITDELAGMRYIDVVDNCLKHGNVPLGIYRRPVENGTKPFVNTNCRPEYILNANDLLFVIKNK